MPTDPRLNQRCQCGLSFFAHLDEVQRMQAGHGNPVAGDIGCGPSDKCIGWRPRLPKQEGISLIASLGRSTGSPVADADWVKVVEQINDIIDQDDYAWAYDTLDGIRCTIQLRKQVTERQLEAIDNIRNAVERRNRR